MDIYQNLQAVLNKFPKAKLGFYPTPLQKLSRMSKKYGVNIYLKREDFSGISVFGGNKVRKLQYLMGDAVKEGCDTVFTYGATQSNHAMQTATVARECGMKPILYLAAIVPPDQNDIKANLLLDAILGAEIHIVAAEDGNLANANLKSGSLAKKQIVELEKAGHKCYDIPPGGANELGTCGFIECYLELHKQMDSLGRKVDFIFTATGTGGTLSGLVAGKNALKQKENIIGITVGDKPANYPETIVHLSNKALQLIGYEPTTSADDFIIDRNYFAPGYEQPNEKANAAIRELAQTEGIMADTVYSGKAFSGMLDYIKTGKIKKGSNVIFMHTGGTTALFSEKEIIGSLANLAKI